MKLTIWHNPRCSKSRQTLELIQEKGYHPQIVEYQKHAPPEDQIRQVLEMLEIGAHQLIRTGDALFRELQLSRNDHPDKLVAAMHAHPTLIERPVVIAGSKAAIGRPPERVLDILPKD